MKFIFTAIFYLAIGAFALTGVALAAREVAVQVEAAFGGRHG